MESGEIDFMARWRCDVSRMNSVKRGLQHGVPSPCCRSTVMSCFRGIATTHHLLSNSAPAVVTTASVLQLLAPHPGASPTQRTCKPIPWLNLEINLPTFWRWLVLERWLYTKRTNVRVMRGPFLSVRKFNLRNNSADFQRFDTLRSALKVVRRIKF
jgi:hypothetical protein